MARAAKDTPAKRDKASNKKDEDVGALFIPAGVLMGMGFGFALGNVPAGLFIGLGFGFLAFAITSIVLYLIRSR